MDEYLIKQILENYEEFNVKTLFEFSSQALDNKDFKTALCALIAARNVIYKLRDFSSLPYLVILSNRLSKILSIKKYDTEGKLGDYKKILNEKRRQLRKAYLEREDIKLKREILKAKLKQLRRERYLRFKEYIKKKEFIDEK